MPKNRKPIGQILLERGIINEDQLTAALARQERWGRRLGENLVALGFMSERQLAKVLGEIYRMPTVDLRTAPISKDVLRLIPVEFCRKHHVVPIKVKMVDGKDQLVVAVSDPSDIQTIDELRFLVKFPIYEVLSTVSDISEMLLKLSQPNEVATFDLLREVSLPKEKEGVSTEIVPAKGEEGHGMFEVKTSAEVKGPTNSLEKKFEILVQLLVDNGIISDEQGRRLLTL